MNTALILSGGTGARLGTSIPKQYLTVNDKPILSWCMERFVLHEEIDAVHIVAAPSWQTQIREWMEPIDRQKKFRGFSSPGENRQLSILHGLEDIRKYACDTDCVMIHDGARPLVSAELVSACLQAVKGHDGALPVISMKDTVYQSTDGRTITSLLDRNTIFAGQAPEAFLLGKYYEANIRLLPERILEIKGSTEPAIMAGMDIAMIPGDEGNFKITTGEDLERFRQLVLRRENK
ncbi:MAG TPA: 2-C-methyl-D-erythritol 4-phosphate cytidylyltransferase [Lachnospiraceae bacterium]|nr:2-C-methyl-D-erythritol 4-phosphate cytidylyltransferase [Lachnospiraceae bacterium]